MIYERFYRTADGEIRRRVEIQTELTELEEVDTDSWAPRLRRW